MRSFGDTLMHARVHRLPPDMTVAKAIAYIGDKYNIRMDSEVALFARDGVLEAEKPLSYYFQGDVCMPLWHFCWNHSQSTAVVFTLAPIGD